MISGPGQLSNDLISGLSLPFDVTLTLDQDDETFISFFKPKITKDIPFPLPAFRNTGTFSITDSDTGAGEMSATIQAIPEPSSVLVWCLLVSTSVASYTCRQRKKAA